MLYTYTVERRFQPLDGTLARLDEAWNALQYDANAAGQDVFATDPQIHSLPDGSLYYIRTLSATDVAWERMEPLLVRRFATPTPNPTDLASETPPTVQVEHLCPACQHTVVEQVLQQAKQRWQQAGGGLVFVGGNIGKAGLGI